MFEPELCSECSNIPSMSPEPLIKDISLLNSAAQWIAFLAILRLPNRRKFSAMAVLLALDALCSIPLQVLLHFHLMSPYHQYQAYSAIFYASFFIDAIILFFVIQQIFNEILAPLSGLRRMGLVVFRWIAVTTVVIALASSVAPPGHSAITGLDFTFCQAAKCVDVMEVCLLAFLAIAVHPLGLSYRSRVFGVGLGLGLTAITDLVATVVLQHNGKMFDYGNLIGVTGAFFGISIWIVYLVREEPARQPITLPTTSPLLRWNEIANALGHKGGQVVIEQPSFFLQDVEGVVDRVLRKNAIQEPRAS